MNGPAAVRRAGLLWNQRVDAVRLRALRWLHPGLEVDPTAAVAFAHARLNLAPGARLVIGPRAVTERIPGALAIIVHEGAEVVIGEGAWLRTETQPVVISAQPGARIEIGREVMLNGCQVSARERIVLHERCSIGPASRLYDFQHDIDDVRLARQGAIEVGAYSWLSSDVTVMDGVTIGAHAVVGAKSLVSRDVAAHTLVAGVPARERGPVGDRTHAR